MDKFSNRRLMPRVVVASGISELNDDSILVSGDLNYFLKYGIPLLKSYLGKKIKNPLIINCVDFKISMAQRLLENFFSKPELQ